MNKVKTQYTCSECGAISPKWIGNCPSCDSWNTYEEERIVKSPKRLSGHIWSLDDTKGRSSKPSHISKIESFRVTRSLTKDKEFDRVMGGGIVPGSITLIGGDPGVGKSTLLLQIVLKWSGKSLYVSGEESMQQIKMRADRLGIDFKDTYILSETSIESILMEAKTLQPSLLVIDSIQTKYTAMLDSVPGSVSQVRECTTMLQRYAKETNVPVIIIGHINKEGSLAGPKVLEHIVDTVLQFEGDAHHVFRLLRTKKNRFGSTAELGIYEMHQGGLQIVTNPSKVLLGQGVMDSSGNAVGATLEGMRPIMIETQALVSTAVYGTPQRSTTGFDIRRLHMLLAVLEKRCGLFYGQSDVFLNIAGGIRVTDPALDMAVMMALISSLEEKIIPRSICFAGEVGLSGELRAIDRLEQRILEAEKLGFRQIFISRYQSKNLDFKTKSIQVIHVANIDELYRQVFVD